MPGHSLRSRFWAFFFAGRKFRCRPDHPVPLHHHGAARRSCVGKRRLGIGFCPSQFPRSQHNLACLPHPGSNRGQGNFHRHARRADRPYSKRAWPRRTGLHSSPISRSELWLYPATGGRRTSEKVSATELCGGGRLSVGLPHRDQHRLDVRDDRVSAADFLALDLGRPGGKHRTLPGDEPRHALRNGGLGRKSPGIQPGAGSAHASNAARDARHPSLWPGGTCPRRIRKGVLECREGCHQDRRACPGHFLRPYRTHPLTC